MQTIIPPRYLPTYRHREITLICDQAMRGESLCFIGIAGSGKSNLIKSLRGDAEVKRRYLGAATDNIYFPDVDLTGWDETAENLWRMMYASLDDLTGGSAPPAAAQEPDPLTRLIKLVAIVCQQWGRRVMFLLDEFDGVFRKGPPTVFEQLSRLRSAGNREWLSYLVFTRKLPHVLGREHDLETQSKFYDLLRYNIYALPLHNLRDSKQMLDHLNAVAGLPLTEEDLDEICRLTGGHSRLIKITFEVCRQRPSESGRPDLSLAQEPEIQDECRRIINGLHRQEREVAVRLARGQQIPLDEPTVDHLRRRELISADGEWFSPFMKSYLRDHQQ